MHRNSASLDVQVNGLVERSELPSVFIIPDTPPIHDRLPAQFTSTKTRDYFTVDEHASDHLQVQVPGHDKHHEHSSHSSGQTNILGALSIGAPLIASVVSSCTSGISADLTSILGADPSARPARASALMALLWCALITSLGATMTAVAGLAMSSGYHDAHVGVTKRIVRFVRQWQTSRHPRTAGPRRGPEDMRPPSPALSTITDTHKDQHALAAFRAAVVSARLLGLSVALLAISLAMYLFLLYPLSVAASTMGVGILTAAVSAAPLLPIIWPSR